MFRAFKSCKCKDATASYSARLLRTDFLVDEETDSGLIFTRSFHCLGVRLYLSHGDAFVSEKLN